MLARTFLRWLAAARPADVLDIVAVRGGPLLDDMAALGEVVTVLDPFEAGVPREGRRATALRERVHHLPPADATLLVSVAAGQVLPLLSDTGPIVTWSVEAGDDLHWVDEGLGLRERTARWLAGSETTKADLLPMLGTGHEAHLSPEFIPAIPHGSTSTHRPEFAPDRPLTVLGAGIGTWRKGIDLFAEVALAHSRHTSIPTRYVWVGGESDDLYPAVRAEVARVGPPTMEFAPSVGDLGPWFDEADVFVHAARLDSFPLVCLHAAASAVPVLGFRGAGGLEEMFGAAFAGRPFPDVAGLAALIDPVACDEGDAPCASAQQARVLGHFTVDTAGPILLRHLTEVAGAPAATP